MRSFTEAISFGTYRLQDPVILRDVISYCYSKGIRNVDTAQLYKNESLIAEICKDFDEINITTKISKDKSVDYVNKRIEQVKYTFGDKLKTIMLHHPMDIPIVKRLFLEKSVFPGFSNYNIKDLEKTWKMCRLKPKILQAEFHPFIPVLPLLNYCKVNDIQLQGHTILCQGKYLDFEPLKSIATKYKVSVAQVMIRWAYQHGIDLCLTSRNLLHIDEWLRTQEFTLEEHDMAFINGLHINYPYRFYKHIKRPVLMVDLPGEQEAYVDKVVENLIKDFEKEIVSDTIIPFRNYIKKTYETDDVLKIIKSKVCDEMKLNDSQFFKNIAMLKKKWGKQHANKKMYSKSSSCSLNRILFPEAMPVEISDPSSFNPLITHLLKNEETKEPHTFIKGTVFPDGRLDLCKQVTGYKSIKNICDAVAQNDHIKHFLLGNNIAFDEDKVNGAGCLGNLMKTSEIETWYLAGNCITPDCAKIIAESLYCNQYTKALWLKRNPIGPGTKHLNKMLNNNNVLELLDLHNCGLRDNGCELLFDGLQNTSLKHLYLDANDIHELKPISDYIMNGTSNIETLYLSLNPIDSKTLQTFFKTIAGNPTIKRLCLSSCGIDDTYDFTDLYLPNLIMIDLGMYKSTSDLGLKSNRLTDASIPQLKELVEKHQNLQFISLYGTEMYDTSWVRDNVQIWNGQRSIYSKEFISRYLKQPQMVYNIDSIYRGKI
jgi:diketogulonate reductase-like aldo/keto reductase